MGSYVDKSRKIIKKSSKIVIKNSDPSNVITKIVPILDVSDSSRVVFYSEYLTSSNVHGIVTVTSGFLITIAAGTATANNTTVSWVSQQITINPSSYGIVSIHKTTGLAAHLPGIHEEYIPISVVASTTSAISMVVHLGAYGYYICSREQVLIDGSWEWANEYSKLLGSGKNLSFSTSGNTNELYLTFTRNGASLRRRFSDLVASDWEFYPDYTDNGTTRYMMPNDKSLLDGLLTTFNNPITRRRRPQTSTYQGTFSSESIVVENATKSTELNYYIVVPSFSTNSMVYTHDDLDCEILSNGNVVASDKLNKLTGTIIKLPDASPVVINIRGSYQLFSYSSENYDLVESTTITNKAFYVDTTTPLTHNTLTQALYCPTQNGVTQTRTPLTKITATYTYDQNLNNELFTLKSAPPISSTINPSTAITATYTYDQQLNSESIVFPVACSASRITKIIYTVT